MFWKSKQRQEERLQEAKDRMTDFSNAMVSKMKETTELGREILAFGNQKQIDAIVVQYKYYESCKYQADKLLLDIKLCDGMRQMASVSSDFHKNASSLLRNIGSIQKDKQLNQIIRDFAKNVFNVQAQTIKAQENLDKTVDSFNALTESLPNDSDLAITEEEKARITNLFTPPQSKYSASKMNSNSEYNPFKSLLNNL